jgi:dTDP-4-amino-4,6-dideoxygalactose transaminase
MKVALLDLKAQFAGLERQIRAEIDEVLASQHFILGPKVERLERELATYCGTRHAVGVSSGTDAILLALMALNIGPGDEVITTPYTFFATAGCIARVGATPVFVDIEPATMNLDVARVSAAITKRTRAILPVHLFGRCVQMDPLRAIAQEHGLSVIEDAAQALGAEHRGRRAGSWGDVGCFSFFPSKNLGAFGDAGLVTTNDDEVASRLRMMRVHGAQTKYFHQVVGGNFRLDALQAAVLLAKLPHLDGWTAARQKHAQQYTSALDKAGLLDPQGPVRVCPSAPNGDRHVMNQFVVRASERDGLMEHLKKREVQTEVYYPRPMHLQDCFKSLNHRAGDFPIAEAASRESLALPVHPELPAGAIAYVVEQIADFYRVR